MNKLFSVMVGLSLMTVVLPSCRLFKHKTGKKKKAEMAAQAKILDSTNAAVKNDTKQLDTTSGAQEMVNQTMSIWQKRIDLKTFSAKAKMHYEGGEKSLDFVANIRLQKDSIIWVSVTVAGIVQVARAIITPDSFRAVLYTEKEYYSGPIEKVNNIMPAGLDFYSLQNVLLGNPALRNATITNVSIDTPNWVVRSEAENYIEQLKFDQSDSTLRSSLLIANGNANKSISQLLSSFELFNNLKISTERKVNILNENSNMLVEMSYSNVGINNELTFPFNVPQNYTKK